MWSYRLIICLDFTKKDFNDSKHPTHCKSLHHVFCYLFDLNIYHYINIKLTDESLQYC